MDTQSSQLARSVDVSSFAPDVNAPEFNARILVDARKLLHGGIGVYTQNLIAGLSRSPGITLGVIGSGSEIAKFAWGKEVEVFEDSAAPYSFDEMVKFSRRIPQDRFDIFHEPHFTLPFGIRIPSVVTIHDLIHLTHPERPYYPSIARPLIRSTLRRANKLLAVSHSTMTEVLRLAHNDPSIRSKLVVVPNAVDQGFVDVKGGATPGRPMGVCGPYFLSVISQIKPHKGVEDLLHAFAKLRELISCATELDMGLRKFSDVKLVLVGQGVERLAEQEALLNLATATRGVQVVGAVSKVDLIKLYASSRAVVVPSFAEGFCLPALEAKAMGIPVVTRPVPANLEIVDRAVDVVCEDFSVDSLVQGMLRALGRTKSEIDSPEISKDRRRIGALYSVESVTTVVKGVYSDILSKETARSAQ